MIELRPQAAREGSAVRSPRIVTAFLCVNCARPGVLPTSAGRPRPAVPDFGWPMSVQQVLLPCTGRLQPEHVLKAFEAGADVVCAIGCREDNCHHLEGSRRCARRVEHVRSILDEVGVGRERLLFFTLPGSAAEDLALGAGKPAPASHPAALAEMVAAVRDAVVAKAARLPPTPLRGAGVDELAGSSPQESDLGDDDNED